MFKIMIPLDLILEIIKLKMLPWGESNWHSSSSAVLVLLNLLRNKKNSENIQVKRKVRWRNNIQRNASYLAEWLFNDLIMLYNFLLKQYHFFKRKSNFALTEAFLKIKISSEKWTNSAYPTTGWNIN